MEKLVKKSRRIDAHVLMANLFVMFVGFLGAVRAFEFIIKNKEMKDVSRMYTILDSIVSLDVIGWVLFTSSLLVFITIFFRDKTIYWLLTIGSFFSLGAYFFYAVSCVLGAELFVTTYTAMGLFVAHIFLLLIGVLGIWKKK